MTLVGHYAITGTVRKRYPFDGSPPVYLKTTEPGSFDAIFGFLTEPNNPQITSIAGALAVGAAGSLIASLITLVFSRAVGREHESDNRAVRREILDRPGNIEALTDAVEPSLKRAHAIINNGAGTINIYNGDVRISHFDATTKAYLEETVLDRTIRQKEVSVNMLNVNTRYGRIYDFELNRTVPIRIDLDAERGTLPALASSLRALSRRVALGSNLRGVVVITFITETTLDGTVKRYLVRAAEIPAIEPPRR